jgi:hypothetical protein
MRVAGLILMLIGTVIFVVGPLAFSYLDELGCAMNTTGCKNYKLVWGEAARYMVLSVMVGAIMVWVGWMMRR